MMITAQRCTEDAALSYCAADSAALAILIIAPEWSQDREWYVA